MVISTECLGAVDKFESIVAQDRCVLMDSEPLSHEYESLQAAPPPANVREWLAYQPNLPPDQRKVVSTDFPADLLRRIDRQLRRASKLRLECESQTHGKAR